LHLAAVGWQCVITELRTDNVGVLLLGLPRPMDKSLSHDDDDDYDDDEPF